MLRVPDAIFEVYEGQVAIVVEIIRITIAEMRIETHIRIVREKQRTAAADAHIQLDPIIGVAVDIVISFFGVRPVLTIIDGGLRFPGPTGVIKLGRHRVRGRGDRQQINDHGLVESSDAMVDVPREIGRPVPVKRIALRGTAVPIPLDGVPEVRNILVQTFLTLAGAPEVLPRGQQTFH